MAIPASEIVSVNPRVLTAGGSDLEINGLVLTRSELVPLSSIAMTFASADSVGEYFGTDSDEYSMACVYFQGYDNCFRYPTKMVVARYVDEACAAFVRGAGSSATLAELKTVTSGAMSLTIDGAEVAIEGVDLSGATSLSDVAEIIEAALAGSAAVSYSSLNKSFTITSGTTGADSAIDYAADSELAELLGLTQAAGAVLSQGSDAMSVADNFAAIRKVTDNWVTFSTTWEATADEALAFANWASGMGVQYLYVCWSTDKQLESQSDTTSVAVVLADNDADSVTVVYGDSDYAAFIMGCAASIDWDRNQGVITFAFRAQDGLAATVTDVTVAQTLLDKKVNFYGTYATRNDAFVWLYDGKMFGDYGYIDPYINAVWLNNALQVSIMEGLQASPRTPYNDTGYTLIRAWMTDPTTRALRNGVIDEGVTLSEAQKAEVYREVGSDISTDLYSKGYVIIVEEPSASVRVDRGSPTCSIYYCYGGSVHRISVDSTALL